MTRKENIDAPDNAPYDDEPPTAEDEEAIRTARDEIKSGKVYPIENVFRDDYLADIHDSIEKLHDNDI